jgi:hypothetical protein
MVSRRPVQFQIGDRVRERGRVADDVVTSSSPNCRQVFSILRETRKGQVVGFEVKRASNGSAINCVLVQWDHLNTPSIHARGRLEKLDS